MLNKERPYDALKEITSVRTGIEKLKELLYNNNNVEIYTSRTITDDMFRNNPDMEIVVKSNTIEDVKNMCITIDFLKYIFTSWFTNDSMNDEKYDCNSHPHISYLIPEDKQYWVDRAMNRASITLYRDGVWYDV